MRSAIFQGAGALSGRAGAVTTSSFSYASTIDAALTDLRGRVSYQAGFSNRPILLLLHGLQGSAADFDSTQLARYTSAGFFVVMPSLRGLGLSSGDEDISAREIHDMIDMVDAVRTDDVLGPLVSQTRCGVAGYSNGGAGALALIARCPDLASVYVAHFPPTNYALFYTDTPAFNAYLQAQIGGTPTALPNAYASRSTLLPVVQQLVCVKGQPGPFLHLIHDQSDPVVPVHHSTNLTAALGAAGIGAERFAAHYSNNTQAEKVRFIHGYAAPSHPGNARGEALWLAQAANSEAWEFPRKGRLRVHGFFRSRSRNFSIWIGPGGGANPKTDANGGLAQMAIVDFDLDAETFRVTPDTGNLLCRVEHGALDDQAECPDGGTTILEAA